MRTDCLKLTAYFGERARTGALPARGGGAAPARDRYLADALLDRFGRERIELSVLLRGAEGFGAKHTRRTDQLLTLSEDLPLVAIAVDHRDRIEAILDEVRDRTPSGLLTLERARLLRGPADAHDVPAEPTKLTVYVGRRERIGGVPAYLAITDLLHRRGVAGATVLLGVDGTSGGERRRARFLHRNGDVPMLVIAIADGDAIARVLPELHARLPHSLITLERVRVCKRDGELLAEPHALPGTDERGMPLFQKLMVYASEQTYANGRPLHQELIRALREAGAPGATTLRGVWGFHGAHAPHGDRLLQLRRNVPTVTTVIDSPGRIASSFAAIDALTTSRGLVTSELLACRFSQE